jgi:hypothetical protein
MSNVSRGEISLDIPFNKERTDHFVLKFTNAGHRAMEDFLGMESSEVMARIASDRVGARLITGLLWGSTRKFHAREFPTIADIDDYLDEINDEAEDQDEASQRMFVALFAAYTRSNPSDIEAALMGEEAGTTSDGESVPKGRGNAKKPAPKKTSKSAKTATGETSSAKPSSQE